jgi:hypothetical protein
MMVEASLYHCWQVKDCKSKVLPMKIPKDENAHSKSRKVLYRVAGWILGDIKKFKGLQKAKSCRKMQQHATVFATKHAITKHAACERNLPVSYMKEAYMVSDNKLHWASKDLFDFFCRVEIA